MSVSIVNATFYIFQACCTNLSFVTPPVAPPQCQCSMDLYNDSLCPPTGRCNKNPKAVTYGSPPLCPITLNCDPTDYIRFQFSDGIYIQNIKVRHLHQLTDIQCVNGHWRYYGVGEFGRTLLHIVCYSIAIPALG